jgi:hypothetical protein
MRVFLAYATGMSADALIPISPSASQSTESPVINASSMHRLVLMVRGMHNTIAGRMEITKYGENWK